MNKLKIIIADRLTPIKVVKTVKKDGYEIRTEIYSGKEYECEDMEMEYCYNESGDLIGDKKDAKTLVEKLGIKPEKADKSHSVCSIGFSEKEQKWFGWSHRATCGFGIGDEASDINEDDKKLPKAKTLEQAKKFAIEFAKSVS